MKRAFQVKEPIWKKLQPCPWARRKQDFPGCGRAALCLLASCSERTRVRPLRCPGARQPRGAEGPMSRGQPGRASSQTRELRTGERSGLPLGRGFRTEKSVVVKDFGVVGPYRHFCVIIYHRTSQFAGLRILWGGILCLTHLHAPWIKLKCINLSCWCIYLCVLREFI